MKAPGEDQFKEAFLRRFWGRLERDGQETLAEMTHCIAGDAIKAYRDAVYQNDEGYKAAHDAKWAEFGKRLGT